MVKNKFYKNLYHTLSFFIPILILIIILFIFYIELPNGEKKHGWILLVLAFSLVNLYFITGFYWIFQKVIIDENGIKIVLFNKIIKETKWKEIETIKEEIIKSNLSLRIILINGSKIRLDHRKSIIKAINIYSQINIVPFFP